ncbi:HipA domain-containing protein [Zoogloea sp.]|uniref:HipA domain-containing protein n=1 Tax=Zoogloea sp. TaxID=49181 RepID=UPI001DB9136B|nr:HipA domain-containing protein [Zoogloea sp.]MBK6655335.1 HipA domain-containing protein [Zoogloea sp.]
MELDVLLNGEVAGTLSYTASTHRYAFRYSPAWLSRKDRYALGPTLPLELAVVAHGAEAAVQEQHSAAVRQFFENLLPEGQALDDAASTHRLSKGNLMGLLAALGGETAGALQLRQPGTELAPVAEIRRALAHAELSERIRARPFHPFSVWDGRVHLSIAGYQDKIAVFEEEGLWSLVEGRYLASTHILKPEPVSTQFAGLTGNEFFCMRLAHWAKLPVAEVALVRVPEPVLVVKRFDREHRPGRVVRRHIIDGCQALGLSSALKYERPYGDARDVLDLRDGASLPMLFAVLARSPRPVAEARSAFNGERRLDTYALAIGNAFQARELSPFEWAHFAHACALPFRQLSTELSRMAGRVHEALPKACDDARRAGVELAQIEQIQGLIAAECERQAEMAPAVAKVDPSLY